MKQVFFQGEYYATFTSPASVHIPLEHELTGMRVVMEDAQRWPGDDIKVVALIMHKFIAMPICGQITTSYVAYELEDVGPREHLFAVSKPSCIPPYPEKEDVMSVRATDWTTQNPTFAIAVVRNVTTQKYLLDVEGETSKRKDIATSADLEEQDYFVGDVELERLHMVGRPVEGHLQRFKGSGRNCFKVNAKRPLDYTIFNVFLHIQNIRQSWGHRGPRC